MDVRFEIHNQHLEGGLEGFVEGDPHLRRLAKAPLIAELELLASS